MACKDNFGKSVKAELIWRGMTITDLAAQIGKSRKAVSSVLNGNPRFPIVHARIEKEMGMEGAK